MNSLDVAEKILRKSKTALSPNRMYKMAIELGFEKHLNFKGQTPWASFGAQIYVDIKKPNSRFEYVSKKPILIKLKDQAVSAPDEQLPKKVKFHERDLHPVLVKFLYSNENFQAFCKTIYHEKSTKNTKGADKWLYPDVVGISFEYSKFRDKTLGVIEKFDKKPLKFYSFEIKIALSVSNFREYFFQAVSNSSWANEGYLVALNIDESDTELMELITKLSLAFGIGVISLDGENFAQSKIIAPARFRENINYSTANELEQKNDDFAEFLKIVLEFDHKNENRYMAEFDEIMSDEKFEKYLKIKEIC